MWTDEKILEEILYPSIPRPTTLYPAFRAGSEVELVQFSCHPAPGHPFWSLGRGGTLHFTLTQLVQGDHGGSTLLPPNVTNEFPEYGTMEEGGEGLRASLELDAESLACRPQGPQGFRLLAGQHSGLASGTGGPPDVGEAPSQSHLKEQSLQPIDSLISALKATEARIASGTLKAAKVLDRDVAPGFSVQQVEKEPDTASHKTQRANELFPAGREKPPDIPLSAEVMTEENFYLSIQKDLTALLTGETQAELSRTANNGRKGVLHVQEPAHPAFSVGSPATHSSLGSAGLLRERRSDQGGGHPGRGDQGSSAGRPGQVKHVEFQGVEILWTGGEKRDTRQPVDFETLLERTTPPEGKEFSKAPGHPVSCAGLCNSAGLTGNVWDEAQGAPAERLAAGSGPLSPVPLLESGEDEVFLRDNKEHLEKKPGLERDKQRALEQEEPLRGGEDDVLGPGCAEDPTDVYSSQFEAVLDNTSLYYSAGSSETLYSEPDSYFSFEMPLTPMIQQRIKEGGQFLERTPAGGQQDILSVSADGGVVMGCSGGITNGLSGSRSSVYSRGTPEAAFWGSISLKFTRRPPARVDCRCSGQDLLVPLNLEGRFSGTSKLLQGTFASAVSFHRECPSEHLYSTRRVQHMDWVNGLLRVFCGPEGNVKIKATGQL
ncbi:hypothetical protein CB1_001095061 [Camelus ferus]|nr:hypothetical protein CB1_001095061 [Camelus ferus]